MKIVIEGTPEEIEDALRRLARPQELPPARDVFVPRTSIPVPLPEPPRCGMPHELIDWTKVVFDTKGL